MKPFRVGFLFNHNSTHQVGHSLPIAQALVRDYPDVDVNLYVAPGRCEEEVRNILQGSEHAIGAEKIIRLRPPSVPSSVVHVATGKSVPADRVSILARNLAHFRSLDALVVPEKTSLILKSWFGLKNLALIHTRHGAGDRAIGFDKSSAKFDLVLMSGKKIRDRLESSKAIKENQFAIVGYPKFDIPQSVVTERFFKNDRPTVLYNPHPSPALSSWYKIGPGILKWFARQDTYNLIFAPHVMLFSKKWTIGLSPFGISRVPAIPEEAKGRPNIWIDTGSRKSVDMTYTASADIYLGDASSQVYEFLLDPRPCVFLNPNRHSWKQNPDFAHWSTGPVIQTIEEFARALEEASINPHAYRSVQKQLFNYSFDLSPIPSSDRAAQAIISYLSRERKTNS